MIVIRDVFQLQFGKAREAQEILKRGRGAPKVGGYDVGRLLVDLSGDDHTLVMESRAERLAAFEEALSTSTRSEAWREAYAQLVPHVREGRREILREVD